MPDVQPNRRRWGVPVSGDNHDQADHCWRGTGEDSFDDVLTVCIAHGRFVPCRRDGEHRESQNPFWVKSVHDYQGSTIEGLTWEPAWEANSGEVSS